MKPTVQISAMLLLAGCGGDGDASGPAAPPVHLEIAYDPGRGGDARRASLDCEGGDATAGGYLEGGDASRLCREARELRGLLTEPPDPDRFCAAVFAGPQTARVTGTLGGERVDRRFARTNGCEIGEFGRLAAAGLVPEPE